MAWNQGWGSRYPGWGILTPTHLFVFKSSTNTTMLSNCGILSCYHCDKINSIGLNKKYFFHMFGLQTGVGVKIPRPRYLDPHTLICFLKLNKYYMISKTVAVFHVIHVIELIPLVWIKKLFHIFGLESGVGVKIPWPGYLDPHPLIVSKSSINTLCYQKLLQYFMLSLW